MKFFKVIWYLVLAMFVVNLVTYSLSDQLTQWDFINQFAIGISLIPLYGYAWQKPIGNKLTAIGIFIFNSISFSGAFYIIGLANLHSSNNVATTLTALFALTIFSVLLYPQYLYAFRSENLWHAKVTAE